MIKFSTLNYLINSFYAGKKDVEILQFNLNDTDNYAMSVDHLVFEPSQSSIDAILNFASQYEVLKSRKAGNIELNLN